jgi:hypothetical protein
VLGKVRKIALIKATIFAVKIGLFK